MSTETLTEESDLFCPAIVSLTSDATILEIWKHPTPVVLCKSASVGYHQAKLSGERQLNVCSDCCTLVDLGSSSNISNDQTINKLDWAFIHHTGL